VTPAEFAAIRGELGLSQAALARVLDVARITVLRWENGLAPIPHTVDLAIDNIRHHTHDVGHERIRVAGHRRAVTADVVDREVDVVRVMREEGLPQDEAIRAFGVEP
jgi:DNA-binding XRE family transcriptional regulator